MAIGTMDMCSLELTNASVFSKQNVVTNNADVILGFIKRVLLAAGWTQTAKFAPAAYWTVSVSSFPTQSPGTLIPWTYPSSALAATWVVAGATWSVYFFDPTKYLPTTPSAHTVFANVAASQTTTAANYAAALGTAIGGTGSSMLDGSGNAIIAASDSAFVSIDDSNQISGTGFGIGASWGYHGSFPPANTHFVNGGYELQSQAANGRTQYKVRLLRGGEIPTSIATLLGVVDYSGGKYDSSVYGIPPLGDQQSYGQYEYNIVVVEILDSYGGSITYEVLNGTSAPGSSYPKCSNIKMFANPYQFLYWMEGWALTESETHIFASAPYVDPLVTPGLNYCLVASSPKIFAASQYPGATPFMQITGQPVRGTPSWRRGGSIAINGSLKTLPPGATGPTGIYQSVGLVGMALGNPLPLYSPNGLPIISTPWIVAPTNPDGTIDYESVLVGKMWDAAYVSQLWGTLDSPSAPNETGGGSVADLTYEMDSVYNSTNWKLAETSVLNSAFQPWQSLWMKVDSTV